VIRISDNWLYDKEFVSGIKGIPNSKDTKRMARVLDKYGSKGDVDLSEMFDGSVEHILLSTEYLKRLYELAKGSKSDVVDIHIQTDKPIIADLYDTGYVNGDHRRGRMAIAPNIKPDLELDRERFKNEEVGNQ